MEADLGGRTPQSDVIVGCVMIILSIACGTAYSLILWILWNDGDLMKMTSYKLMFVLGVFDVVQCLPHLVTGVFTIRQSVFHPTLAKSMGVLATPAYVAYTVLTVVLAINRFLQIYSPRLDSLLFNSSAVRYWIGLSMMFWLLFAVALSTPWATISYYPELYSWDYDYTLKLSFVVQKCEMVIELGTILISAVLYIFVIIALYRTRKRFMSRSNCWTEIKILIQALVITVYCTVLNFLWHNSQTLLPSNIWSYMALNMMWILNSGVYPIIYFIVNKAIRDRLGAKRGVLPSVSMYSRGNNRASTDLSKSKVMRTHFDGDRTIAKAMKSKPKVQFVS